MTDPSSHHVLLRAEFRALRALDADDRERRLVELDGSHPSVAAELRRLLSHHDDELAKSEEDDPTRAAIARAAVEVANEPAAPGLPPVIDGYVVRRVLGEGGMGLVLEAEQPRPRRLVALKVLRRALVSEADLRRFRREGELLGRLRHPGIATVFETGTFHAHDGDRPYIAMELVDGRPLSDVASELADPRDRLRLLAAVCEAVGHAHEHGVLHCDLKPANVLVEDRAQPRPRVLDFGVGRLIGDADPRATMQTGTSTFLGTLPYLSPEQCIADADLDARSDVHALGAIGYELLAGRPPFGTGERDPAALIDAITRRNAPAIDHAEVGVDRQVATIIAIALEKSPADRYPDAGAMAADLRRALRREPIHHRRPGPARRGALFVARHRALSAATAVVVVGLTAALLFTLASLRREHALRLRAESAEATSDAARVRAEDEARISAESISLITDVVASAARQAGADDLVSPELILDRAADRVLTDLDEDPLVQARLLFNIAIAQQRIGRWARAQPLLEQALARWREYDGASGTEAAATLLALGLGEEVRSQFDDSERHLLEVLDILEPIVEPTDPRLIETLATLGSMYHAAGRFELAAATTRDAIERLNAADPNDVPNIVVAITLTADGYTALEVGDADRSLRRAEETLRGFAQQRERGVEPDPLVLMRTHRLHGQALAALDRDEEAVAATRSALEVADRTIPRTENRHRVLMQSHASALERVGLRAEAAEVYEALVESYRAHAPGTPDHGAVLAELGRIAAHEQRYGEAEELFREGIAMMAIGSAAPDVRLARAYRDLGLTYGRLARPTDAVNALDRAVAAWPIGLARFEWERLNCVLSSGAVRAAIQAYDDSERIVESVIATIDARPRSGVAEADRRYDSVRIDALDTLGLVQRRRGASTEVLERTTDRLEAALAAAGPEFTTRLLRLASERASKHREAGDLVAAGAAVAPYVGQARTAATDGSVEGALVLFESGVASLERGIDDGARADLERAVELLVPVAGAEHPFIRRARLLLARTSADVD